MNKDQQIQKIAEIIKSHRPCDNCDPASKGCTKCDLDLSLAQSLHNAGCVILPEKFEVMSDKEMLEYCHKRNTNPETRCTLDEKCKHCNRQAQADADMRQARGE